MSLSEDIANVTVTYEWLEKTLWPDIEELEIVSIDTNHLRRMLEMVVHHDDLKEIANSPSPNFPANHKRPEGGEPWSLTPFTTSHSQKVVIYIVEDWSAVYVDGIKKHENHVIPLYTLQEIVPNVPVGSIEEHWVGDTALTDFVTEQGVFPTTILEANRLKDQELQ